ncbi:ribonuclease P protein component [Isoptericola variabilis J7]|uniref:Ribonuclease P protein component n=1 Tax=Isoptericola variabilis (strain 225) TaxID=743718 RepID=F6FWQ7_ISOV2|nr:ribonuclease P protein component [Isoptericola variabilis 225]TWH33751.1 ribonuclease P protein component [Isoptericola variabilis J7]
MVVHLALDEPEGPPQVGLVVSKAVGNAVHRNLVKRRLRSAASAHLDELPDGALAVVRALPQAAQASYSELDRDVAQGFHRAVERSRSRPTRPAEGAS